MYYVNPEDVMRAFKSYLTDYGPMISKETAINELNDALDSAGMVWMEEVKQVYQSGDTNAQPLTPEQLSEPIAIYDTSSIYEEVIR